MYNKQTLLILALTTISLICISPTIFSHSLSASYQLSSENTNAKHKVFLRGTLSQTKYRSIPLENIIGYYDLESSVVTIQFKTSGNFSITIFENGRIVDSQNLLIQEAHATKDIIIQIPTDRLDNTLYKITVTNIDTQMSISGEFKIYRDNSF